MTRRALALGAAAVVVLAGCSDAATAPTSTTVTVTVRPDATPAGSTSGPVSGSSPTGTPSSGPTISVGTHRSVAFGSPTGNINCAAYLDQGAGRGWGLRCDVLERSWTLPPKPADCEFAWGFGVSLDAAGARLVCASDTVTYEARVGAEGVWWGGQPGSQVVSDPRRGDLVALAYGATITMGAITCQSRQDGMHCTNTTTRAGFDVNRESYTLR